MMREIVGKQLLESILSLRFIISLLLVISVFTINGIIFVDGYKQRLQDYHEKHNENLYRIKSQATQLNELPFHWQEVYKMPKPLTLCSEAFEETLPSCVRFNVFAVNLPQVKGQSNFTLPHDSRFDWTFVISLILSFVALMLTYDCICGEREAGTLQLMLAGSLPRYKILIAKYVGTMITLGIPLLFGLLANLAIVVASKNVPINASEWLKILAMVFLAFIYLSIFVLLGVFISSRTVYAAHSMVILLLIWVGVVVLVPSLGRIYMDLTYGSLDQESLPRRISEAKQQVESQRESGKYGENAGMRLADPNQCNPPARARYCNALTQAENRVIEDHYRRMIARVSAGRNFALVFTSPTAIYQRASEVICGTGLNRCTRMYQHVKDYQAHLREYVISSDMSDPGSLHLLFDEGHTVSDWNTISKKAVNYQAVPKYQERDTTLLEALRLAVWYIGLLVLYNLVFFTAAFVSFLRYDVR